MATVAVSDDHCLPQRRGLWAPVVQSATRSQANEVGREDDVSECNSSIRRSPPPFLC